MKRIIYCFSLIFLASIITFGQTSEDSPSINKYQKYHAFSGTLLFGADAGVTFGMTDYSNPRPEVIGRALLEYFFPTTSSGIFGLRGFYSAGYVSGKDDAKNPTEFRSTITSIGGGFSYNFSIQQAVFPYIFLGATYSWVNPQDLNDVLLPYNGRNFDINRETYNAELGIRFLLSHAISLNGSVGAYFASNDNWDALPPNGSNDMMITVMAGLSYSLFTDYDSDGDGVTDSKDQCPNTPQGVKVDNFGCPVDTDNDGVPDYKDECPNTGAGMEVDSKGCAIDSDRDGVPDKNDRCPNTPAGAKVNEFGCPDSDADGVYDNEDKCPDTPKGAPVDDRGCPKDSDNDGVPDYKDECPNTPAGKQVDNTGCAKPDTLVKEITLSGDTNFEFNKSTLLPSAYNLLNDIANSIKDNPGTRWKIEGHTDAVGSDSYNMKLSRERAQSVADYLVQQGVDRSRLEIVPLGESDPIATNDTQEGRAMNRRVEIKIIEGTR